MTAERDDTPEPIKFHGPYRMRVVDPRAAQLSAIFDAARDRAWFKWHPEAPYRDRAASTLEMAAFGLPQSTIVVVRRHEGELFYFFAVHRPAFEEVQARAGQPS